MLLQGKRILITGGAGFIGSHLSDRLVANNNLIVFDNLSRGIDNINHLIGNPNFTLIQGDLLKDYEIEKIPKDVNVVFHLAANPEVKVEDPKIHFEENVHATYKLLETIRKNDIEILVFTSTSTVYGEPKVLPTPEDYAPLLPISLYGASKLACESLISAYSNHYGIDAIIYRMANVVGPRTKRSVVRDFFEKLKKDPTKLEILGDGTQDKSYTYIDDCIDAILFGLENSNKGLDVFNIGSEDRLQVKKVADIVCKELGLDNVKYIFKPYSDGRGWPGDVKLMHLSINKLKSLGWKPKFNSEEAIRECIKALLK